MLTLDFERERADVRLQSAAVTPREDDIGERHRAFVSTSGDLDLEPAPGDGLYVADGPAQFLIDTCNGVPTVDRAPATVGVRSVAIIEAAWQSALERRHVEVEVA